MVGDSETHLHGACGAAVFSSPPNGAYGAAVFVISFLAAPAPQFPPGFPTFPCILPGGACGAARPGTPDLELILRHFSAGLV